MEDLPAPSAPDASTAKERPPRSTFLLGTIAAFAACYSAWFAGRQFSATEQEGKEEETSRLLAQAEDTTDGAKRLDILRDAVDSCPTCYEPKYQLCVTLHQTPTIQALEEAQVYALELAEDWPNRAEPLNLLGSLAVRKSYFCVDRSSEKRELLEQAIKWGERALEVAPGFGRAHYNLCSAYSQLGVDYDPRYYDMALDHVQRATLSFERVGDAAHVIDSRFAEVLILLGLERCDEAMERAEALVQDCGDSSRGSNAMGLVHLSRHEYDLALKCFEINIGRSSSDVCALYNAAVALSNIARNCSDDTEQAKLAEEALAYLGDAIQLAPSNASRARDESDLKFLRSFQATRDAFSKLVSTP